MVAWSPARGVACALVLSGVVACVGKREPPGGTSGDLSGASADAGSEGGSSGNNGGDGSATVSAACPLVRPVSSSVPVSGQDDCKAKSIGRWALCHAERDYTGKGDLASMWNGADGVEYTDENGVWTFYYLRKQPDGSLARIGGLPYYGRVEFTAITDGKCDVTLRAEDGISDAYNRFQYWDSPAAYRDFVYDIYDFVRVD